MLKKKIYLVQPNSIVGNSVYFPYAIGVIAAYAFGNEYVHEEFEIGDIVYREEPVDTVIARMDAPFVAAFSNYFWNYEYNLRLASQIKNKFPDCTIIFGGHQIAQNLEYLEKYPFIDILIYSNGEIAFTQILEKLGRGESVKEINNIAYRNEASCGVMTPFEPVCIEKYPSPYQTGIFDSIIENKPDNLLFNALLETNRGCPYQCAYCDWNASRKVTLFDIEQIKGDIRWISEKKIEYCMCVDANFGMFERDEIIADEVIKMFCTNGYPKRFGASYAKNKNDTVFNINLKFNKYGLSKGVSLAFQSMSDTVLENVGRSNISKDELIHQLKMYHEAEIPTYTELILGLPGETRESFCRGMCELLELGQHDCINVFRCEVYPNAGLSKEEYIRGFDIKYAPAVLNVNHCPTDNASFSGELMIVKSTNTMSKEDMTMSYLFSACIQCFHCHGLIQCFAIYVHNELKVSYYDFYNAYVNWMLGSDGFCNEMILRVIKSMTAQENGKIDLSYQPESFCKITWPYDEAMFLHSVYRMDEFYGDVEKFLSLYDIPEHIYTQLLRYQKSIIAVPGLRHSENEYDYDFVGYFSSAMTMADTSLSQKKHKVELNAGNYTDDWDEYSREIVWYGRRNRRMILTSDSRNVSNISVSEEENEQ